MSHGGSTGWGEPDGTVAIATTSNKPVYGSDRLLVVKSTSTAAYDCPMLRVGSAVEPTGFEKTSVGIDGSASNDMVTDERPAKVCSAAATHT